MFNLHKKKYIKNSMKIKSIYDKYNALVENCLKKVYGAPTIPQTNALVRTVSTLLFCNVIGQLI